MVGQRLWDLVRGGVGDAIHHRHEEMQDSQVARGGDGDWPVVSACVVRACEMKPERDPTSYCTCFDVPTSSLDGNSERRQRALARNSP